MKVSRLLVVVALAASCAREPADDHKATAQPPEPQAVPDATTGEEPASAPEPTPANAARASERAIDRSIARDERAAAASPVTLAAARDGVNISAAVMQDFKQRVDAYMKVRSEALKDAPALKESKDPAKIKAAQDAQSARIRELRAGAKPGDVFTAEIRAEFRRLLAPELKGDDGNDAKKVIKDDAPTNVPFKVNAKYPEGASLPTVPASLLLSLPQLPEPLQYRIIDKHLILLDEDADVIVDYIANAIR
jgi:hypothetical protein